MRPFLLVTLFIILSYSSLLEAAPSVDVPLRHWSYDAIEKLAIIGLCDIADIGARPVSRIKMAFIIKSAIEKAQDYSLDFEWNEQEYLETLLYKLIDEFREELVTIGVDIASITDKGPKRYIFRPVDNLKIEKLYTRLDANRTLFENKDGWVLRDGLNARLKIETWAKISELFAVSLTPGVRYSSKDTDCDFENAHIRFNYPEGANYELAVGRSSMWWGPGFHGSLLMTDNSFPLDTVRFNNIRPFRLPFFLRKIGRFSGLFFVSRLEKKGPVEHPWVSGWRLDYTPWGFLKFGFGHILMFGGKGVKKLDFSNFWAENSLIFSPAGGGTETENHIISGDMQLFLRRIDRFIPLATGIKLYTEWGAEDEAGNVPIDLASIIGAYFTDIFTIPGFDGKIEFAKLNRIWYTHFRYTSGYKHRGNIIGHHIGPDSEDIAITGIFNFPDDYKISATLSHQKQGLTKANIQTTNELRIEFSLIDALNVYNIKDVEVDIFYELEDIRNYDNTSNKVKNHILGAEVRRRF